MKSPSLDVIYSQIHKHILLAQAYTEVSELDFIIRACRLKPYDFIFGSRNDKIILYRWWFDEFGNSLKINTNKRIKIVYNDLILERDHIISTDLYYGLSLEKISKMSKFAHLCAGKDEDTQQECALITFLGIDNYFRSYLYYSQEWMPVSPLLLGLKNLRFIAKNRDVKYFAKLPIKEKPPIPCQKADQWITFLPSSPYLGKDIEEQYPIVSSIFK
jgi:hypothetical protein